MPLIETRADVPVTVDDALCIDGCTLCVDICPLDSLAISPDSGKAYMHVDECWYCGLGRRGPARGGGGRGPLAGGARGRR